MTDALAAKTIVFDRTPLARLVACAAAFGSAALFFDYLSRPAADRGAVALVLLGLLFAGSVLAALLQYGDHIYVAPEGVLYENRWLRIGALRGGWMRWDDVVEIREVRRKILVLFAGDGRRLLVDSIAGYPIARREILRRTPHAVISGTLTAEDRS